MNKPLRGIGIDQGIANCGYSVVELSPEGEVKVLKSGTIRTYSYHNLSKRIERIYETVTQLLKDYDASILGCEHLFFSPKQKSDTNKSGRNKSASIVYTNMATGILFLASAQYGIPIKDFVPGTVKKYVTGNGRATKDEVKEAVLRIVEIDKEIETEHEADATAIGITAVRYAKALQEESPPEVAVKKKKRSKKTSRKGAVSVG